MIGWLTLRGRATKLTLLALATPVLYGLGAIACELIARQPVRRFLGYGSPGVWTTWVFAAALLLGVLPVCVPVLVASLLNRRPPADPVVGDVPADGTVPSPAPGVNSFAMASLVLGLTGGSIVAVVFGHLARSQIRRTKEAGGRLAVAGLVLGYVGIFATAVLTLMGDAVLGFVMFVGVR